MPQEARVVPAARCCSSVISVDKQFADKYTQEEREAFEQYLSSQIDKTEGMKLSEADRFYMYNKMLQMYSNPLSNYLEATK